MFFQLSCFACIDNTLNCCNGAEMTKYLDAFPEFLYVILEVHEKKKFCKAFFTLLPIHNKVTHDSPVSIIV